MTRNGKQSSRQKSAGARGVAGSVLTRRAWLGVALGGAATALMGERWWHSSNPTVVAADAVPITVYSSPSCGCCHKWVSHLKENGFLVTVKSVADVSPIKRKMAIPEPLWSCHTGVVSGLAIEGHIPAELIKKALAERPAIIGLSAPGMPGGAPGMDTSKDPYEVIAFASDGRSSVYAQR